MFEVSSVLDNDNKEDFMPKNSPNWKIR